MTQIVEWYVPGKNFFKDPLVNVIAFFVGFLTGLSSELLGFILAAVGFSMLVICVILALVEDHQSKLVFGSHRSTLTVILSKGALLLTGSLCGIILVENMLVSLIITLITVLFLFIFLFFFQQIIKKTQERIAVETEGSYSLEFLRHLVLLMERWFLSTGFQVERKENGVLGKRNVLRLLFDGGAWIEWRIDGVNSTPRGTRYSFVIRTNRSKEFKHFKDLKDAVSMSLHKIETGVGIDSFSKVKNILCIKCKKNAFYNGTQNLFYCNHCGNWRGDSDVIIETEVNPFICNRLIEDLRTF